MHRDDDQIHSFKRGYLDIRCGKGRSKGSKTEPCGIPFKSWDKAEPIRCAKGMIREVNEESGEKWVKSQKGQDFKKAMNNYKCHLIDDSELK